MEISGKSYHLNLSLEWLLRQLLFKLLGTAYRVLDVIRYLPLRLYRLLTHFWLGLQSAQRLLLEPWTRENREHHLLGIFQWYSECLLYTLDILGFSEFYETLMDLGKFNSRPLHQWEIQLARSVFGDRINYKRVRIDEYAWLGPRQYRICYVSFYTVNSWGTMHNSLLLHELTHVWQYQQLGAVYIFRALMAQRSVMGYNYGGLARLQSVLAQGQDLAAFNLEQQGDLVADYYRIREGYRPYWGNASRSDLPVYEVFIQQIQNKDQQH